MRAVLACVLLWCAGGADAGLVWSDEFNGGSLDEGKWNYDLGMGSNGWGNNELQSYTKEAVRVGGGVCSLELTRTHGGPGGYESGKIHTRGKGDFRYGRFEARIKLPTGRGTWPAFWMLPTGNVYGGWPRSGEIDILEHVGYNLGQVHGTVHTQAGSGAAGTGGHTSTDVTQFHVYGVVWTPTQIDWYLDGAHFFTYRKTGGSDTWPFNQDFYLILNLAYGGDWGGAKGVDDSIFSRRVAVEVDYVRVYDDVGGPVPVPVPGPVPTPPAGGCGTGAAACDGGGCFTCRQRMDYLKGQGQSEQAAGLQVAREFPNECAGCGATCNLDAKPCGSEGCYTCRQRLDYLQNTNGMTPQAAGAQLVKEYPQECAGCEAGLAAAGPAPVPVTPSPPTCNLDAKPCGSEGCYTCRQRLDYLQNTNGMTPQAAGAQLVKEFPQECAGCEAGLAAAAPAPVPVTPSPPTCNLDAKPCGSEGCYTCRQRLDYLQNTNGMTPQAAGAQLVKEYPQECAGCEAGLAAAGPAPVPVTPSPPTCNLDAKPCGSEGCYTCRQRLDYLQNTNGMTPQAAGAQLVKEFPQECAGCEAGLAAAAPAPVPVTPSPPTCNLDAKPCGSEGCYTCRQRLDYLQNTNGMTPQAAGAQLVKEYPQECAGCEAGLAAAGPAPVPVTPSPPTCNLDAKPCGSEGCYTCRQRLDYLQNTNGMTPQAAGAQLVKEFPQECAGCEAGLAAAAPAPVPVTPSPPTCNLDAKPCGSEGCYTCRQRLDYLQNTNGLSSQAAGTQLVKEYPQECAGCEDGLGVPPPAPPTSGQRHVRIMTYNLFGWNALRDAGKTQQMLDQVKKVGPDVLGTQETEGKTSMIASWVGMQAVGPERHGVQIFVNPARFSVMAAGTFNLQEQDQWGQRIGMWARLWDRTANREYVHVNTHLCVCSSTQLLGSATTLATQLSRIAGTKPAVLTGDLNVFDRFANSQAVRYLTGQTVSGRRSPAPLRDAVPQGGSTFQSGGRIDYVLYKGMVRQNSWVEPRTGSDHHPVVADLSL